MKTQLHRNILIYVLLLFVAESTFSQPTLLKDIYPGPESSYQYMSFYKFGNKIAFEANDGIHGPELWLTDGTTEGTIRMEDNTEILKDTINTLNGNGLYKTVGTKVVDVFANFKFNKVTGVTAVNGIWFFVANVDSDNMGELWKSDGTEVGTMLVKKIRPNSYQNSYTQNLIASPDGKELIFSADNGNGIALWKSDGTGTGTIIIKTFYTTAQHQMSTFINFKGATYFWAKSASGFRALWKTDGTPGGTEVVHDKLLTPNDDQIIEYKDKLYFQGQDQNNNNDASIYGRAEIWVSDGTSEGTRFFFATNPDGLTGGFPDSFQIVNDLILFLATTELSGTEWWVTDGSKEGTFMLKDIFPGKDYSTIHRWRIKELNKVFFTGKDGNENMLWETDGTKLGTKPFYDISESDIPMVPYITYINNKLIFVKQTVAHGKELWSFSPTLSVDEVQNNKKVSVYPNPVSSTLTINNHFIGIAQLTVINNLGQVVLKQNQNTTSLDVSNLSKGLYFLNIEDEVGKSQTIKFIKK